MSNIIRADYEELDRVANRFNHNYDDVQQMLRRVQSMVNRLRDNGWIGRGANAFYDEMDSEVLPAVLRLMLALEEAGMKTKQINALLEQAEKDAAASFN